ncbi:MAG TPA: acyl carrier protein [Planctomycetes bacterium]|jgi:acyl carrier protein|nr:acyl carrier protein [Planctomycetota bacterium]
MTESDSIKDAIRQFLLTSILEGVSADELTDDTELVTSGVLDSLSSLKLVSFLEEHFSIRVESHEVDAEFLNTLDLIANLVASKKSGS